MKKFMLTAAVLIVSALSAMAQYNSISFVTTTPARLVQIDEGEDSNILYFTYTAKKDMALLCYNAETAFVRIPGTYKKYKCKDIAGIGDCSADVISMVRKQGGELNFAIEFEKFPLDGPFSIKEDAENDSKINIEDITVVSDGNPLMDTDEFILSNPSCFKGQFAENGITYSFWNYKGMGLIATFANSNDDTHLFYIHMAFVNDSGNAFEFDPASVTVEHESKNGRRNTLKVFNATEYENRMKTEKFFQTAYKVASVVSIVESVGNAVTGGQLFSTNSLFQSPVLGYIDIIGGIAGVANGVAGVVNSDANMERLNNVFGQMKDKYLVPSTIESGGAYGGYLSLNEKKKGHYLISVPVFDRVFTFSVEE